MLLGLGGSLGGNGTGTAVRRVSNPLKEGDELLYPVERMAELVDEVVEDLNVSLVDGPTFPQKFDDAENSFFFNCDVRR